MYSANSELEEKDSVSPAMIQRIVKHHQYHEVRTCFTKLQVSGERADTSGTREMARARSAADRYGAVVVVGVLGKRRKPYRATGRVIRPSI